MKKTVLAAAAALAMTAGFSTPAFAADRNNTDWINVINVQPMQLIAETIEFAVGLLIPAVNQVRA